METSYLEAYERYRTPLSGRQLAVFAGLYAWRDRVCRQADESTGYVLPRGQLLSLAQAMPGAQGLYYMHCITLHHNTASAMHRWL